MLLFKKPFWEPLKSGAITLTFRRWQKPHVKPRGRYRCHPIGVLEVDAIELVTIGSITAEDAAKAGFETRDTLVAYLAGLALVQCAIALGAWWTATWLATHRPRVPFQRLVGIAVAAAGLVYAGLVAI